MDKQKRGNNVGFISTRFAGTDGVSMETTKWAKVFEKEGFTCFYMAGELDRPSDKSLLVKEAHFLHPDIQEIQKQCFDVQIRKLIITHKIQQTKDRLKKQIYIFIKKFKLKLLMIENALTIPVNIPLGLAITEVISETGIKTIAHHHDFFWERERFLINAVRDYLDMSFPPHLPSTCHVTINSLASKQLSFRKGISSKIIPNVMDFENQPPLIDEYSSDVRKSLGIKDDELFILQPTRVIKRKGIEHAVELISHLGKKAKLVISHTSGDEGYDYEKKIKDYSTLMKVKTLFVSDIINEYRGRTDKGGKIYSLFDIYPHADLITYPSEVEGFGNNFLEAIYFRKPIVINNYPVYITDIKSKGFKTIEMNGYITKKMIKKVKKIIDNFKLNKEMVDYNYELGKRYYSYAILEQKLKNLLSGCSGE